MKRATIVLFSLALFFVACKEEKPKEADPTALALRSEGKKLELPYQLTRIPDWEIGDDKNVPVAMNVLKCYEVKDFVSINNYLADTVEFRAVLGHFKGSRKEFVNFLKGQRNNRLDVAIEMNDYESVKSKSRGEEWVSLWYTEVVTDRTGKSDSAQVMDDYKMVNGKVALIDSKVRMSSREE